MIREHDPVALTVDVPEFPLRAGDVAVVIDMTSSGKEVALEFFTSDGLSFAVVSLPVGNIRALRENDRTIERVIQSA